MINNGQIEQLIPLTESDCKAIAKVCEIIDTRNEFVQYERDGIDKHELIEVYRRFSICLFMIDPRVATYSKSYREMAQAFTCFDQQEHDQIVEVCKLVDIAIGHSKDSSLVDHLKEKIHSFTTTFNHLDMLLREYHDCTTEQTSTTSKS